MGLIGAAERRWLDGPAGQAEVLCWGVLRSGLLQHPVFVQWRNGE